MFTSKQMVLRGNFVPRFQVPSHRRLARVVVNRGTRLRVSCSARINSSLWKRLPSTSYRCTNVGVQCKDNSANTEIELSSSPRTSASASKLCNLVFDKLQVTDEEISKDFRRAFGRFVAREAVIDEEYWSASWLRAEAHWEPMSYMRHVDSYKRKYAEQVWMKNVADLQGFLAMADLVWWYSPRISVWIGEIVSATLAVDHPEWPGIRSSGSCTSSGRHEGE